MAKTKRFPIEPYFNAYAKGASATRRSAPEGIFVKIVNEFKNQQRAEIQKWRRALQAASDPEEPRLYPLQDMFDNLKSDGHYISQTELRKAATLCSSFSVIDKKTGEENPKKTEFFRRQWFYDLMDDALEYLFRGYTVLELTDAAKPEFKLIPRRNLIPRRREVLLTVNDTKGVPYADLLGETIIEIGNPDDLGIMADLCGQLIWKRNAQQAWAEYSEKFGLPLLTATTNKSSDADIARIQKMLSALGEAAQAVLPEGTTIDIKEAGTGDNYLVYDKQIERFNTEIGKPITGGTMLSDNGSSRSQSEVHERNLDDKIAERDKRIIAFIANDQVIPMLARWGHPLDPETDTFTFDKSFGLTLKEHWEIVRDASALYEIPAEWVSKTFGFPINAVRETPLPAFAAGKEQSKTTAFAPGSFTANFR